MGPAGRVSPGPKEVLIRVAAAGVNRPDLMQHQGKYPPPPGASLVLGLEVAGIVEAVGSAVERWREGDRVCALVSGGGYSEYCLAPEQQCLPVPAGFTLLEAAALPENYFTVWTNVFNRGRLARGEALLVHGGASGIGTTAIQLAHAFEARVFATAGSDAKCRACERLGADAAVNYNTSDFVTEIKRLTAGRGVDVILDMVGGSYFPRNLACLAVEGRLVQIATQQGKDVPLDLAQVMSRRLTLTGSTLRPRSVEEKGRIARELEEHVWPLLNSGAVRPVIHATFPLARAEEALATLEKSSHIGKIMLTVNAG